MKIIKNRDKIVEELTDMLVQFEKDCNAYNTDVYLYYNEETKTAELDTFVNPGGNSWLNDDHYTIYTDEEHGESWHDYYTTEEEFAECLGIDFENFKKEVFDFLDFDEADQQEIGLNYDDALEYVLARDDYAETLIEAFEAYVDELKPDLYGRAEEIISEWETED